MDFSIFKKYYSVDDENMLINFNEINKKNNLNPLTWCLLNKKIYSSLKKEELLFLFKNTNLNEIEAKFNPLNLYLNDELFLDEFSINYFIKNFNLNQKNQYGYSIFYSVFSLNKEYKFNSEQLDYMIKNSNLNFDINNHKPIYFAFKNLDKNSSNIHTEQFKYLLQNTKLNSIESAEILSFAFLNANKEHFKLDKDDYHKLIRNSDLNFSLFGGFNILMLFLEKQTYIDLYSEDIDFLLKNTNLKTFNFLKKDCLYLALQNNKNSKLTIENFNYLFQNSNVSFRPQESEKNLLTWALIGNEYDKLNLSQPQFSLLIKYFDCKAENINSTFSFALNSYFIHKHLNFDNLNKLYEKIISSGYEFSAKTLYNDEQFNLFLEKRNAFEEKKQLTNEIILLNKDTRTKKFKV